MSKQRILGIQKFFCAGQNYVIYKLATGEFRLFGRKSHYKCRFCGDWRRIRYPFYQTSTPRINFVGTTFRSGVGTHYFKLLLAYCDCVVFGSFSQLISIKILCILPWHTFVSATCKFIEFVLSRQDANPQECVNIKELLSKLFIILCCIWIILIVLCFPNKKETL